VETWPLAKEAPGPKPARQHNAPAKNGSEQYTSTDLITRPGSVGHGRERSDPEDEQRLRPWPRSAGDAPSVPSVLLLGAGWAAASSCVRPADIQRLPLPLAAKVPRFQEAAAAVAEGRERVILRVSGHCTTGA